MTKIINRDELNDKSFVPDEFFLNKHNLSVLDIEWLDNSKVKKIKLKSSEDCYVFSPEYKSPVAAIKTISPHVYIYEFENLFARVNSSNFFDKKKIIIERLNHLNVDDCNYRAGSLVLHGKERSLVKKPKNIVEINHSCLFLGGNGSFNYYHWLIEIASKILLVSNDNLQELGIKKIIVNRKALEIKQFKEILDVLISAQKIKCKIIAFDGDDTLFIKKLYYINTANNHLYNANKLSALSSHCYLSKEILSKLRSESLRSMEIIVNAPKKIFLLRNKKHLSKHNKRDYNEEQVFEYFKRKGFEGVLVESYSFKEQVYLFNNADFIVGPSGAFWANIIYCKADTKAISWLNENMKEFSLYSTLAKQFHCDMCFCESSASQPNEVHGPYKLKIEKIEKAYNKATDSL